MDTIIGIVKVIVLGLVALLVGLGVWTVVKLGIAFAARRKAKSKAACKTGACATEMPAAKQAVVV